MAPSYRQHLIAPVRIGTLPSGQPVWSVAGGDRDDEPPAPEETSGEELESETFEIPADLSGFDEAQLDEIHAAAVEAFDELSARASELDDDGMQVLEALADGITRIDNEREARENARQQRAARAAELASKVRPSDGGEGDEEELAAGAADEPDDDEGDDDAEEEASTETTASSAPIVINMSGVRRRQDEARVDDDRDDDPADVRMRMVAADGTPGLTAGAEINVDQLSEVLCTRLHGITVGEYAEAARSGNRISTRLPAALIKREVPEELRVGRPGDTQSVLTAAIERYKEQVTPGVAQHDAITASAWCAPSTPIYDICELENTGGGITLPSIVVDRGGVINTTGPDFSAIFSDSGFCFSHSELEDQSPPGSGPKPSFTVPCPDFEDTRLGVCGTAVRAGLLQNRAYPELVQRTVRGALTTHTHQVWGTHIADIIAGSTTVNMPADQVGAAAPILTAIELQVTHFRYVNRAHGLVLEAVFPDYVYGMIRSDLSRRLGVDMLGVTDAQINAWFADRGVAAQFVYNFDDITGPAGDFTSWQEDVRFLLYAPGTWVAGNADIIRIDTLFDSALLEQNDFTALFMEEGLLTLKTCPDSRVVSVPVCPDGATHGGVDIDCDGAEAGS